MSIFFLYLLGLDDLELLTEAVSTSLKMPRLTAKYSVPYPDSYNPLAIFREVDNLTRMFGFDEISLQPGH